jgi:hypothetical protein
VKTKWEILQQRREEAWQKVVSLDNEIAGLLKQSCGLVCGKCGAYHETEADFAKHYVIPDTRYLNLGWCPNGDNVPPGTIYDR